MICKSLLGYPFLKRLFGLLAVVGGAVSPQAAEGLYIGGDLGVVLPGSLESTRTNIGIPTNCDQWLGAATLLDGTRVPLPASECQPRTLPAAANEFDLGSGFAAGLNAGFRHGRMRFEAEYLHRRQEGEVLPLVVAGDSKQREFVRRDEAIGDVTSHGLLANLYWDLGRSLSNERLRPYLGAGLGAARVGIDYAATSIRNSDPQALLALGRNPNAAGTVSRADESLADTLWSWQLIGGVDFALGERRALVFKARYGGTFGAFEARGNVWEPLRGHASTVAPGGAPVRYDITADAPRFWAVTVGLKFMVGD